jgi:hypothetical protein
MEFYTQVQQDIECLELCRPGVTIEPYNITTAGDRDAVLEQIVAVAAIGFRQSEITDDLKSDVRAHVTNTDQLFIIKSEGRVEGFACARFFGFGKHNVLHLQGLILTGKTKGLGSEILGNIALAYQADVIAFHTQCEPMMRLGTVGGRVYDPGLSFNIAPIIGTNMENLRIIQACVGDMHIEIRRYYGPLYGEQLNSHRIPGLTEEEKQGDAGIFAFRLPYQTIRC